MNLHQGGRLPLVFSEVPAPLDPRRRDHRLQAVPDALQGARREGHRAGAQGPLLAVRTHLPHLPRLGGRAGRGSRRLPQCVRGPLTRSRPSGRRAPRTSRRRLPAGPRCPRSWRRWSPCPTADDFDVDVAGESPGTEPAWNFPPAGPLACGPRGGAGGTPGPGRCSGRGRDSGPGGPGAALDGHGAAPGLAAAQRDHRRSRPGPLRSVRRLTVSRRARSRRPTPRRLRPRLRYPPSTRISQRSPASPRHGESPRPCGHSPSTAPCPATRRASRRPSSWNRPRRSPSSAAPAPCSTTSPRWSPPRRSPRTAWSWTPGMQPVTGPVLHRAATGARRSSSSPTWRRWS